MAEPKRIEAPDGSGILEFPSDMPDAEIIAILQREFTPDTGSISASTAPTDFDITEDDVNFPGVAAEANRLFAGEAGFGEEPLSASDAAPYQYSLQDALASALRPGTLKRSAVNLGEALIAPFQDPVGTAESLGQLISGVYQKFTPGVQEDEKVADAVGQFFADRYGGYQNIKDTLATDPFGLLADASTVATLGGTAIAQAPAKVGQVGQVVRRTGQNIDPLTNAARLAAIPFKPRAAIPAGLSVLTGSGPEAIKQATQAGADSISPLPSRRRRAAAFRENLRGKRAIEDVVNIAEGAMDTLRQTKNAAYRASMRKIGANPKIIGFDGIDSAVSAVTSKGQFKGQTRKSIQPVLDDITEAVADWKKLDPAEFHTAEGLDFLKKQLGDIRAGLPPGSPQELFAGDVYRAVKKAIDEADPRYATAMKDYAEASELITDIRRSFSLDPKASLDTKIRKLQSIMRDNVSTNYGRRTDLARKLEAEGADTLMPSLAGQQLSSLAPRGLARLGGPAVVGGASAATANPAFLFGLGLSSPRLVGEGAYYTGKVYGPTRTALRIARDAGIPAARLGLLDVETRNALLGP